MPALADFRHTPNALAPHYARFRVAERLLLTGHSHQAWPDAGFEGQVEAWADAAELVDEKWDRAEAKAARVRRGFGGLLATADNEIVLDLLEQDEVERARHVVGWLMWAAKAYGVKAVNPGGGAAWKRGRNAGGLHEPIEGYHHLTPAGIIGGLARIADELSVPHPLHLHCVRVAALGPRRRSAPL